MFSIHTEKVQVTLSLQHSFCQVFWNFQLVTPKILALETSNDLQQKYTYTPNNVFGIGREDLTKFPWMQSTFVALLQYYFEYIAVLIFMIVFITKPSCAKVQPLNATCIAVDFCLDLLHIQLTSYFSDPPLCCFSKNILALWTDACFLSQGQSQS